MIRLACLLVVFAAQAHGESIVAARTIPARSVIGAEDLLLRDVESLGAITDPSEIIGLESRVALYAGRPIRLADVGPPAIVERNQIVTLHYSRGGLAITTEGRALERAGPGEIIRVMNVMSRHTVTARIDAAGVAHVTH